MRSIRVVERVAFLSCIDGTATRSNGTSVSTAPVSGSSVRRRPRATQPAVIGSGHAADRRPIRRPVQAGHRVEAVHAAGHDGLPTTERGARRPRPAPREFRVASSNEFRASVDRPSFAKPETPLASRRNQPTPGRMAPNRNELAIQNCRPSLLYLRAKGCPERKLAGAISLEGQR